MGMEQFLKYGLTQKDYEKLQEDPKSKQLHTFLLGDNLGVWHIDIKIQLTELSNLNEHVSLTVKFHLYNITMRKLLFFEFILTTYMY